MMSLRTRSSKVSPGRTTRNSLYGRPPPQPQPRKTRKSPLKHSTTIAPVAETAPIAKLAREDDENIAPTEGTPWLGCRDSHGVYTTVAVSQTGQGVHVRWHYPEDEAGGTGGQGEDADMDVDMDMAVNDSEIGRASTPTVATGPGARRPFVPKTPVDLQSFDAGSVIRTPVKKTRQLQRSPIRIGDKGVRCLYDHGGVLKDLNNGNRIVLNHPVGSSANLSRNQVEQLEKERERKIIEQQLARLIEEKKQYEVEDDLESVISESFSDSGYEEVMDTGCSAPRRPIEMVDNTGPAFSRGPNGELLDRLGRPMFGPEGTTLIYNGPESLPRNFRAASEVPTEIIEEEETCAEEVNRQQERKQRPRQRITRFGPEGTQLID